LPFIPQMKAANFSEFRKHLKAYLDAVENDQEILILKRKTGDGTVLMSLSEYNGLIETAYLLDSPKNREHLQRSIQQLEAGQVQTFELSL